MTATKTKAAPKRKSLLSGVLSLNTDTSSVNTEAVLDDFQPPPEGEVVQAPDGAIIRYIHVDDIDANPIPQRHNYLAQAIHELALSLVDGQREAVHVRPHPDRPGRYVIMDGWTRVQAIRTHGADLGLKFEVLAHVHDNVDDLNGYFYGLLQNIERNPMTDFDLGLGFHALKDRGLRNNQIAEKAKCHDSDVTKLLCFARLPAPVLEICKAHPERITRNFAHTLVQTLDHGEDIVLDLAQKVAAGELSYAGLVNERERLDVAAVTGRSVGSPAGKTSGTVPQSPSPAEPARDEKIAFDRALLRNRGNRIDIQAKKLTPAENDELMRELRTLLARFFKEKAPKPDSDAELLPGQGEGGAGVGGDGERLA